MPLLRVPYTDPLPPPHIIPRTAATVSGAIACLTDFLTAPPSKNLKLDTARNDRTVLLTGAGISVASGLADYRGTNGTYTLNRTYKPVYYNEFTANHEARKRYWARSYLGWTNLHKARPNIAHKAVARLGELGVISSCITQNVDSFHPLAHPSLPTTELHGYLRALVCLTCRTEYPRTAFQTQLSALNPAWAAFLAEVLASGALDTEDPAQRRARGLTTNPDGDVDIPGAPYGTFRYPACPTCLAAGAAAGVQLDSDGGWAEGSSGGVLKPAVVMFGESIPQATKMAAEEAVDGASRVLVVGSSLATYSAWRLVKRARENGMPIGVVNIGGVRGEEVFFGGVAEGNTGREAVRASVDAGEVLPAVVRMVEEVDSI
ncbi:DHS-like NAD/FAD-binding domain-containing protein [Mytilinidion resinicola]|uniref:DHS-like NAD/FAD-binding domain-containing protein n=1 Tax=Mytilinidion resinicola TaxID=574789 RepID=A0A6A6Z2R9_9PEZI|nr:DHS-like NAD/FAD-binding domain-containing protein [Mytilinidion resinicola]KAF2814527.1 DHS-like NAD/FAD-binding domain-containing protein [Mytilinidion resinicola]